MASIAILGGSVIGSAAALQFARAGFAVSLIDAELDLIHSGQRADVRPGAPHAVQAHGFPSRGPFELRKRLPDVMEALVEAGVEQVPVNRLLPPPVLDGGRPDDEDLDTIRTRRLTLDAVLGSAVRREPGITLVRQRATGLVLEPGNPPTAVGFGLADGQSVRAELLLDAAGRRSPVTGWLADAGIQQPERVDPCGLSYYGRHCRITGDRPPLNNGFADIHEFPTFIQLMFVGDNDRVQLALSPHADDVLLKQLRHEDAFMAVLAANENFRPWLDVLEPETGIFALGSLQNRIRSLVDDGRPLVRGLHQVGDALAMTNPNRGRGIGMGLAGVGVLVDLVIADGRNPDALALAFDDWRRNVLAVYYSEAASADAVVGRRFRANLLGTPSPGNAPAVELPEGHPVSSSDIERVAMRDPDLFRTFLRALNMLDDEREIASEATTAKVRRLLDAGDPPAPGATGPSGPSVQAGSRDLDDRDFVESLLAPFAG